MVLKKVKIITIGMFVLGFPLLTGCYTVIIPPVEHRVAVIEEPAYEEEYTEEVYDWTGGARLYHYYYGDPYRYFWGYDPFWYSGFHLYSPGYYGWRVGFPHWGLYVFDPYLWSFYNPFYLGYGGFGYYSGYGGYYTPWYGGYYTYETTMKKRDFSRRREVTGGLAIAADGNGRVVRTKGGIGAVPGTAVDSQTGKRTVIRSGELPAAGATELSKTAARDVAIKSTGDRRVITRITPPAQPGLRLPVTSRTSTETATGAKRTVIRPVGKSEGDNRHYTRVITSSARNGTGTVIPSSMQRYMTELRSAREFPGRMDSHYRSYLESRRLPRPSYRSNSYNSGVYRNPSVGRSTGRPSRMRSAVGAMGRSVSRTRSSAAGRSGGRVVRRK